MARAVDLKEQVFGTFTALGRDASATVNTRWLCQCNICGEERSILTYTLRAGRIPRCRCVFEKKLNDLSETVRAYIAGLFDGEGSIYIGLQANSRSIPLHFLEISITNTDKGVLEWIKEKCGGRITKKAQVKERYRKPIWAWKASSRQAASFLGCIKPYLRIKTEQADVAIMFQERVSHLMLNRMNREESEWRELQRTKLIAIRGAA
jgi:LAGLIDADG-like domain